MVDFYSEWTKFWFLFTSKAVFIPFLVSNRKVCLKGKIVLPLAHWTFPFPCSFHPCFILSAICSHVLPKMWLTIFSSLWPLKRQGWSTDAIHKSQAILSTVLVIDSETESLHRLFHTIHNVSLASPAGCFINLTSRRKDSPKPHPIMSASNSADHLWHV